MKIAEKSIRCTQTYVLRSGRAVTAVKGHILDPQDHLLIDYRRNASGDGMWTQFIKNLSKDRHLDTLTAGDKPATQLDFETEMQGTAKGTSDEQIYTNTTIVLRKAEPEFGSTLRKSGRVFVGTPKTNDGGKTWTIDKMVLGAMYPGTSSRKQG
ncbi:hypothetical protein FKW77_000425 [Venturia effusa]|uniref:Uncharacterized protein n=1 Tax=Venturia effusa TaxID=50376 RepID=A0A517L8G0_9PEZI|nr:hypothetical protein FKW77_000425 [Venturia effusa]